MNAFDEYDIRVGNRTAHQVEMDDMWAELEAHDDDVSRGTKNDQGEN